jgi:CHAT domain-containing protein
MAGNPDMLRNAFDNNPNWGIVALRTGRTDEARRVLTNVVQRNVQVLGERHWDTAMSRGMLGAAKLRGGDATGALADFDAAAPILMQSSRQADDEESGSAARDGQLRLVFESMMGALAASNRPGAAEESFRLADAIRGQGVQRALAQSSARAAASDPALAEFVRQEQDTQKQVGALQGVLTNVLSAPERDEAAVRLLRTQIDTLRGARAAIRQEIERRFPDYANLIDPRPATVEQARRSLRPGEALVATYVGSEQSFVWAVPQSGPVAFAAVRAGRRAIGEAVAGLRKSLDPNAASLGDVPAFDVALAHKLYTDLLKPVEAGFANATSLLVVPHDALGQLPFGVLVTEPARLAEEREGDALFSAYKTVPFLIRKAAITQLPSVASLGTLRALPAAPANRKAFVGFGDPWFSPEQMAEAKAEAATAQVAQLTTRGTANRLQTRGLPLVRRNAPATANIDSAELAMLPRLPDTADEVKGIAEALGAGPADVILGAAANERTVKGMDISDRRVVMFATHGLIPGDLNGLLQPALALSAPNVADIDGDGLLTLDEVLALKLNADWVVLSACNTATGDGAGAEAVSGLGRAFFYAGTRALLVTNWPVETTSARALTTDLFARQARDAGLPRAAALQQAMTALIDGPGFVDPASRRTVFAYSHPIFWAPFALVGDGGGSARQVSEIAR